MSNFNALFEIGEPTTIKLNTLFMIIPYDDISLEQCLLARKTITSLSKITEYQFKIRIEFNIDSFNSHINLISKLLMNKLHDFLYERILNDRSDLLPDKHRIWTSFDSNIKRVSTIMILNYHITDLKDLHTRGEYDSLFSNISMFTPVSNALIFSLIEILMVIIQWQTTEEV